MSNCKSGVNAALKSVFQHKNYSKTSRTDDEIITADNRGVLKVISQ